MTAAGRILSRVLEFVRPRIVPGTTTGAIDEAVHAFIVREGGRPSFLGLYGFPKSICASVNEEVVHGIPGDRVLKDGDIFSVDVGVLYKGFHADAARTWAVGAVSDEARRLMEVCARSLDRGIGAMLPGNRLSAVSRAVQQEIEGAGFSVVEKYVGHGIGRELHEDPQVPNFVSPNLLRNDLVLTPGLALAIEPMANAGDRDVRVLSDHWTVVTADGRLSAHFEDTVILTEAGSILPTRAHGEVLV